MTRCSRGWRPSLAARSTASPARPLPCPPHGFWLTPAPLAPGRGAARGGGGGEGRAVGRDATLRLRGGSTLALARHPPPCGRPAGNAERSSSAPARGAPVVGGRARSTVVMGCGRCLSKMISCDERVMPPLLMSSQTTLTLTPTHPHSPHRTRHAPLELRTPPGAPARLSKAVGK